MFYKELSRLLYNEKNTIWGGQINLDHFTKGKLYFVQPVQIHVAFVVLMQLFLTSSIKKEVKNITKIQSLFVRTCSHNCSCKMSFWRKFSKVTLKVSKMLWRSLTSIYRMKWLEKNTILLLCGWILVTGNKISRVTS